MKYIEEREKRGENKARIRERQWRYLRSKLGGAKYKKLKRGSQCLINSKKMIPGLGLINYPAIFKPLLSHGTLNEGLRYT